MLFRSGLMDFFDELSHRKLLGRIIVEHSEREVGKGEEWLDYVETLRGYKKNERIDEIKKELKVQESLGNQTMVTNLLQELQGLK